MINRLYTVFLSLFVSLVAFAQSAGTVASKDAMLYESSRHLYEKGNTLTIISKDFEWPKGLDGSVLPELQHYLTTFFFGQPSDSYEAGWKQFESLQGKEVRAIKDDADAERHYYDMGLRCLWLEPGRYISFLARLEERNETSVITAKHSYFTFDLINKKVLTQKDVFNQTRLWQDPNVRYQLCELLDNMANTQTADSIDWDHLPNQFALIGQNIRFDLGVDNGGGVYSDVRTDMIDVLFSKSFKKWQKQPLSVAVNTKLPTNAVYASLPTDSVFPEVQPQFEGNVAAALGQNISYTDLSLKTTALWRTYASFIVDTDGSLKDIVFLTVNNIELNRSLATALQLLNGWKPALHNGKPVAYRYNLPLTLHFQ